MGTMQDEQRRLAERAARRYAAARRHVTAAECGSSADREVAIVAALRELSGAVHDLLRAQGVDPREFA